MTAVTAPVGYRFGHFEVQPGERRLLARGETVHLGPHAFDLLLVLLERSGHLVTKDELFQRVWGRVIVEENTLQSHMSALRKALGAKTIATVSGRGYRFAGEVARIEASAKPKTPQHNLPHSLTTFVGREKEIAQAKELLTTTRLLTLMGAGGCGKTRLALEVATAVKDSYLDGAWLVELASVADSKLVAQTVANVFSIKEQAGKDLAETIAEWLSTRHLLLVLDNAEHLLGHCAVLVDGLLRRCARLAILVTTREHLGVAGERTYRVPSLAVPDAQRDTTPEAISSVESVRLFVDRARLQQPDFEITAFNASIVAAVCRRLDGIALAIELAAPRVRSMSIQELSAHLDERFRVLTEGSRTALARHRTLRSLIDWSYDLLSHTEKLMLQRVSVFAGGWTLEAAEQVCSDSVIESRAGLDLLCSLVDKNLIVAETKGGPTRYGLLETVGHYARDRLRETGGEDAVHRRHLAYFVALAAASERLATSADKDSLQRLEAERENMGAALSRAAAPGGDVGSGLQLAASLSWFWMVRGNFAEGRARFTALLSAATEGLDRATRAIALRGAARLAWAQGEYTSAKAMCLEGLAICRELGNQQHAAQHLGLLGSFADQQADYDAALAFYNEALAIWRALGDQHGIFNSLISLSYLLLNQGDYESSGALAEQSLAMAPGLGVLQTAEALTSLGNAAYVRGNYPAARKWLQEGLAVQRSLGLGRRVAALLLTLGQLSSEEEDYPAARSYLDESLRIERELGGRGSLTAEILERFGEVALALAGPVSAAVIWGGAERLRKETGAIRQRVDREWYGRQVSSARAGLGDDATFDRAWQQGGAMPFDQLMHYALEFDSSVGSGVAKST